MSAKTDQSREVSDAVTLMAALASASAGDLAHTTNALLEGKDSEIRFWAARFTLLYERVQDEPQVSRKLHDTMDYLAPDYTNGKAIFERIPH